MYIYKKHETYTRCSFNVNSDSIIGGFVCEVMSCEIRPAQKMCTFSIFIFLKTDY